MLAYRDVRCRLRRKPARRLCGLPRVHPSNAPVAPHRPLYLVGYRSACGGSRKFWIKVSHMRSSHSLKPIQTGRLASYRELLVCICCWVYEGKQQGLAISPLDTRWAHGRFIYPSVLRFPSLRIPEIPHGPRAGRGGC